MKHFLFASLLAGLTQIGIAKDYSGFEANNIIKGATLVRTSEYSRFPSFIKFHEQSAPSKADFLANMKARFKSNKIEFVFVKSESDFLGFEHETYQQKVSGIPVEFGIFKLHLRNESVISANGLSSTNIQVSTIPLVSEDNARQLAIQAIGAKSYKWENQAEENHLKIETNNPQATYFPFGELVLIPQNADFNSALKLAWKYNIYASSPLSRYDVYIDAHTGEEVHRNNQLCHAATHGTAITKYSGSQTISVDSISPNLFELRDLTRGNGIITWNMQQNTSYGNSSIFTDSDNLWNNFNAQQDEVATDAHWGAESTYDYFFNFHSRNSIDGNGFTLNSYVHFDQNYANAFWDGQRMIYGDGNANVSPLTTLDIAGHEISHGLTNFTANLIYQDESGALNESFSDIFGVSIEFYKKPLTANWLIGEEIGSPIRNMENPNALNDPDTYLGQSWYSGQADNGGVHTNSGVQNYWYYLLVNGGSGTNDNGDNFNVTGIGITDASKIAFRNLTTYLSANSTYTDARFYAIQSAIDIFGACSPEVKAVTNAWYAVGVGPAYVPYALADFQASATTACLAPLTVNFVNNSINGTSFLWNFGDGTSSTDFAPSHVYQNDGEYDITLSIDGGICGQDTNIKVEYIKVGPNHPCILTLAPGANTIQTSCEGKMFDPGGPAQNYPSNTNSFITIAPTGANGITFNFQQFDIEQGTNNSCDFDFIEFFDGPDITSPSLGKFCNGTLPPSQLISSSGTVFIHFQSDGGLEKAGFELDWKCSYPNLPPTSNFEANKAESCNGEIAFTDLSSNGPNQWFWEFGDGSTSTLQNPIHTYTSSGAYNVKLTATNTFGSNSVTKNSIVNINKPVAPSVANSIVISGSTDTLLAQGNGIANWYTSASTTTSIFTGNLFITGTITSDTAFWVDETITQPIQTVGPVDNTIGNGNYFNDNQHLNFNVQADVILKSVKVYSETSGTRVIELRNSSGTVLQSKSVFIPTGEQRVDLNFTLAPGSGYQLGLQQGSLIEMYRNNSGANYPYSINGLISILSSSASTNPTGFYYFFYDWEVSEPDCISDRTKVDIKLAKITSVKMLSEKGISVYPNPNKGIFYIEFDRTFQKTITFSIADATGKEIQKESLEGIAKHTIDLTQYPSGIYTVIFSSETEFEMIKIVKE